MTPKKTRRYPTKRKTTTKQGKTAYQRRYMKDYRQFKIWQTKQLREAIERGNISLAKRIMDTRPSEIMNGKVKLPNVPELVWGKPKPDKNGKGK